MNMNNFFKDKDIKFLIIIFVIFTVINIIWSTISLKVLSIDGCHFFVEHALEKLNNNQLAWILPNRFRIFVTFINAIPINIAYFLFGITDKYWLAIFWGLPTFLFPALFPFFNYILAKRTHRYDLVVVSLIIFSLLILPTQVWPIVETMLAVSLIFILFHYLAAEIEYKWYDIFFITLITIISFSASESNAYVGLLLFIFSLFYAKKAVKIKEKIVKYLIGLAGFLMPFVYTYFTISLMKDTVYKNTMRFFIEESFFNESVYRDYWEKPYLFLILFILFSIFIFVFRKRNIKKQIYVLSSILLTIFCLLLIFKKYFYDLYILEYRVLLYIVPSILLISIFLLDSKKIKTSVENLNNIFVNLLIITLFIGLANNIIDIANSILFEDRIENLENKIQKINSPIIEISEKDIPSHIIFPEHFSYVTLIISKKIKIPKIIVHKIYEKNLNIIYLDNNKNELALPFGIIPIKTKFWNLIEIEKAIIKRNKKIEERGGVKKQYKRYIKHRISKQ